MISGDSRNIVASPTSDVAKVDAAVALGRDARSEGSPNSRQDSTLLLANGREVSVQLLTPLLQHIVQERKLRQIGEGLEYRVYTSPELEGAVFKLASKTAARSPLIMHPHHVEPSAASAVADDLIRHGHAVPFVRIPLTIPVQSVRTGKVREQLVELVVQREVLTVDRCWKTDRKDSLRVAAIGKDLAAFHTRLITAGYLDADLNCIKNVGYDYLAQNSDRLKLIDLGFVYRLPTDPVERTSAFASYGDSRHPTLGEFFAGGIFDRFYSKALRDKRVRQVFLTLVHELFPKLTTGEMKSLHRAYTSIGADIRSLPSNERVKAYIDRIRSPEHADLINSVLAKLCR